MEMKVDKVLGVLRERDAGGGASGGITSAQASAIAKQVALPKNSSWTTTVGGYTIEYSGDGLNVYMQDGGVDINISSGYIRAGVWDEDAEESVDLVVQNGGITAGGSAITQTTSEFDETSLGIGTLSGGVKYVCQSALTALSIGSAAAGCNGAIIFTVASGAIVTPPANVPYFGVTSYTAGSSYLMMINDFAAVCNEAAIVPGV